MEAVDYNHASWCDEAPAVENPIDLYTSSCCNEVVMVAQCYDSQGNVAGGCYEQKALYRCPPSELWDYDISSPVHNSYYLTPSKQFISSKNLTCYDATALDETNRWDEITITAFQVLIDRQIPFSISWDGVWDSYDWYFSQ